MKKTIKAVIAVLTAALMLMAFASCEEEKKDNEENSLVKGIFESTIASREYLKWKAEWKGSGTTITEKLDGDSIIFKAESTEEYGTKGEFTFKLDGDYLVYTPDDKDETGAGGYAFSLMIIQGVSDYYDMDYSDVTGYLAGVANLDMENKYLINDTETSAVKVYVAEKWDLSELDEMYINEKALEYTDPLNEEFSNKILNCGRMTMLAYGDVNNVQIIFIEKGEKSSDITYKSIMSAVAKLQPKGYKTFAKKYTELKDAKGKGYKVVLGLDKDIAAEHELTAEEGRSYVTVVFNAFKK